MLVRKIFNATWRGTAWPISMKFDSRDHHTAVVHLRKYKIGPPIYVCNTRQPLRLLQLLSKAAEFWLVTSSTEFALFWMFS